MAVARPESDRRVDSATRSHAWRGRLLRHPRWWRFRRQASHPPGCATALAQGMFSDRTCCLEQADQPGPSQRNPAGRRAHCSTRATAPRISSFPDAATGDSVCTRPTTDYGGRLRAGQLRRADRRRTGHATFLDNAYMKRGTDRRHTSPVSLLSQHASKMTDRKAAPADRLKGQLGRLGVSSQVSPFIASSNIKAAGRYVKHQ